MYISQTMWMQIDFSKNVMDILQSSRHYHPNRLFTMEELYDIGEFVHFYEHETHLNFIKLQDNILYGFCYASSATGDYWMFLDDTYRFYDVSVSPPTKKDLGDIYETVMQRIPYSPSPPSPPSSSYRKRIVEWCYRMYWGATSYMKM